MRMQLLATTSMVNPTPLAERLRGLLDGMSWPPVTTDPAQWVQDAATFGTAVLLQPPLTPDGEMMAETLEALTAMMTAAMRVPAELLQAPVPMNGRGRMLPHPLLPAKNPEPTVLEGEILPPETQEVWETRWTDAADAISYMMAGMRWGKTWAQERPRA